jgi:hypothetical protein
MDSTLGSVQIDPHNDVDVAPLREKDRWSGFEDALSRLAQRAAHDIPDPRSRTEESNVSAGAQSAEPSVVATPSDVSASPQVAEPSVRATAADISTGTQVGGPSVLASVRPADFRDDPFPGEKPSLSSRATRAVTRFLIAVCVGVAGSLAWQSYGGAAREMIANWVPQLAWISSRPVTNQTPSPATPVGQTAFSPAIETSAPQPAAAQAASVAQALTDTPPAGAAQTATISQTATEQTAANIAAPTAPAALSSDQQQLEAMARDIGALRQSVEQLVARQEQMARDMAKLQAVEMSKHRIPAPPSHPAAATARKPPTPSQPAPEVSTAVPAVPPSPQPPPRISSEPAQPAVPPQSAVPLQPAVMPQPLRPPMPVPEH